MQTQFQLKTLTLRMPKRRRSDKIKVYFKETVAGSCGHGDVPSGSKRGGEPLDQPSVYRLLKTDSANRNCIADTIFIII
jgi:hypothetical protein